MRASWVVLLAILLSSITFALELTSSELGRAVRLTASGQIEHDQTNRLIGNADAARFGQRLFFSTTFSPGKDKACSTCHVPSNGWTDGKNHLVAGEWRNTPTVLNSCGNRWQFWDGRADSLWSQAVHPFLEASELGVGAEGVVRAIMGDPGLKSCYMKVFGSPPKLGLEESERVLVNVSKAIAAFECTLTSRNSPFDQYIDKVKKGEAATDVISPAAVRGLKVFIRDNSCRTCHNGHDLTNGEFHRTGIIEATASGLSAGGRYSGIASLLRSKYRADGPYSDDPTGLRAERTKTVIQTQGLRGAFKTPSLRNVAITAPYMHNGSFANLRQVIEHYRSSRVDNDPHAEQTPLTLQLTDDDVSDLLAFLETLTDNDTLKRHSKLVSSHNLACD